MQQLPHDETVGVALPAYDSTFKDRIERTVGVENVSEIRARRLFELGQLFNGPNFEKIVDNDPSNNCALGFNKLKVTQPEGYHEIIEHLDRDRAKASDNIWSTKRNPQLKRPTWIVYETLRQIGVRPTRQLQATSNKLQDEEDGELAGRGGRGKPTRRQDRQDFMLSHKFKFDNETLRINRHRLQPSDKK